MPDYDVAVIGAGNGGLSAAVALQNGGLKVLLLERHNIPGGCATSFIRGRFEFEVALHQLSGLGREDRPGPLRGVLAELGVLDELDFVEIKDLYRVVMPGGGLDVTLKADRYEAVAALKDRFPGEARGIDDFFDLVHQFAMEMVGAMILRDPEASRAKYPVFFQNALKSSQGILDRYFQDPLLKMAVGIYWTYAGLPPRHIPFIDLALLLWVYLEFKPFHLRGGSQAMSSALLERFQKAGGEARFSCGAKKIKVKNGRVVGVLTEAGDEVEVGRVVSNAGTLATYLELLDRDEVPGEVMKTFASQTIGTSAFTLYVGLDCDPGDLGLTRSTNFITTTPDMDLAYRVGRSLESPAAALLSCYDVDIPDFSPPGACQCALVTMQYAEPWLNIPANQYADAKYKYADKLLDLAEKVCPGFRSRIEELETASPLTHLRYLGHPGGAIYGFEQYAKDSKIFVSPRSPLQGLWFTGAWAGQGGFQPTLESGLAAARSILKSMNR
ncbi:MAG: NAD(P)/FAD-dependent oxidoreductase [Pseudomonadota bacterium]